FLIDPLGKPDPWNLPLLPPTWRTPSRPLAPPGNLSGRFPLRLRPRVDIGAGCEGQSERQGAPGCVSAASERMRSLRGASGQQEGAEDMALTGAVRAAA